MLCSEIRRGGVNFSEADVITYRKLFQTATGKSLESYDLFVEKR